MEKSFRREHMFAQIPTLPGKRPPTNNHRRVYDAYLNRHYSHLLLNVSDRTQRDLEGIVRHMNVTITIGVEF